MPFLEAIRQFALDVGKQNCLYIHLTLIPFLKAAGEAKTKPTQHSVGRLREIGIQPDILICRTERELAKEDAEKIALFCNVESRAVIEERDKEFTIYEVPVSLVDNHLDELIVEKLHLKAEPLEIGDWKQMLERLCNPTHETTIGVVGKYIKHHDAYKSVYESLSHAGIALDARVRGAQNRGRGNRARGRGRHFAERRRPAGSGRLRPPRHRRQDRGHPATFANGASRSSASASDCNAPSSSSHAMSSVWPTPIPRKWTSKRPIRSSACWTTSIASPTRAAPCAWAAIPCVLKEGSQAALAYGSTEVHERHRHRYELNNRYRAQLEASGLIVTGTSPDGNLVEVIELRNHPWFVAVQCHPEFKSKPTRPHPLFRAFVQASLARHEGRKAEGPRTRPQAASLSASS